jgi:formate-nitrite transporter family protein
MTDLAEAVHAGDHVRGGPGADLELVMYGDFECPYCTAAQRVLARVERRLDGRLKLVFRHFPLEARHPHAMHAAEVAEAAAAQDAFWPMHDALYASGGRLADADLLARAGELGLDADRVRAELEAGTHRDRVERDLASGRASGVTGTPGFFANGTRVDSAFDAGSLVEALLA